MDELLEILRREGDRHSTGSLTVDSVAMVEKLSRHRLADPHFYALPLVVSAYLSGATTIEIRNDSDELELWHDGSLPGESELRNLTGYLLDDRHGALRELAVGLQAASLLKPSTLLLETWDGRQGWRLSYPGACQPLTGAERCGLRFYLREPFSWWKHICESLAGTPEGLAIRRFCAFAPRPSMVRTARACVESGVRAPESLESALHPRLPSPMRRGPRLSGPGSGGLRTDGRCS